MMMIRMIRKKLLLQPQPLLLLLKHSIQIHLAFGGDRPTETFYAINLSPVRDEGGIFYAGSREN